jgi:hypothetical protein
VTTLAGITEAAERLRGTALRDFGPPLDDDDSKGVSYTLFLPREETPVPSLIRYALTLIGLSAPWPRRESRMVGQLYLQGSAVRSRP